MEAWGMLLAAVCYLSSLIPWKTIVALIIICVLICLLSLCYEEDKHLVNASQSTPEPSSPVQDTEGSADNHPQGNPNLPDTDAEVKKQGISENDQNVEHQKSTNHQTSEREESVSLAHPEGKVQTEAEKRNESDDVADGDGSGDASSSADVQSQLTAETSDSEKESGPKVNNSSDADGSGDADKPDGVTRTPRKRKQKAAKIQNSESSDENSDSDEMPSLKEKKRWYMDQIKKNQATLRTKMALAVLSKKKSAPQTHKQKQKQIKKNSRKSHSEKNEKGRSVGRKKIKDNSGYPILEPNPNHSGLYTNVGHRRKRRIQGHHDSVIAPEPSRYRSQPADPLTLITNNIKQLSHAIQQLPESSDDGGASDRRFEAAIHFDWSESEEPVVPENIGHNNHQIHISQQTQQFISSI